MTKRLVRNGWRSEAGLRMTPKHEGRLTRPAPMELAKLGEAIGARVTGAATVRGITYDSRLVEPGDLFCAIPGFRTDGHRYIAEARARGAAALLVERAEVVPPDCAALVVPHSRIGIAQAARVLFDDPSRGLWMVGVTGTNGKTTTTHLIRQVLMAGGIRCGVIGTVHTMVGRETLPSERTTPEAPDLQATLRYMVRAGEGAVAMEVSSHSLALHRVEGVQYDVGVFTNLTQDHLDFHQDMEDYFAAKALLFEGLGHGDPKGPRRAVLNADDPWAGRLVGLTTVPLLSYGFAASADVRAESVEIGTWGSRFMLWLPDENPVRVQVPLGGRFNVSNALGAVAVGHLAGVPLSRMVEALATVPGVPGRFERVDQGQPFSVVVDYAHSPDGLMNVLSTARELTAGRLVAVFGAGGDRDRAKRPLMGEVVGRLADWPIITSDNPRSEDPDAILRDVAVGVSQAGGRPTLVADRRLAIYEACRAAQPGDVVMILGKGHEGYQVFADRVVPFDDRQVAREALAALGWSS